MPNRSAVTVSGLVGIALIGLVAIAKDGQRDSSRLSAAVELLNRGYGRPAQSVDLHLTTEAPA